MKIKNLIIGALVVGILSVIYNYFVFSIFDFYPDLPLEFEFLSRWEGTFYVVVFLKNFLVGLILMILFSLAYKNIVSDTGNWRYTAKGIFFFVLYAIFALISFTLGDIFLMRTSEGMLLVLTLDGFVETLIATIPIKIFSIKK